MTGCWQLLPRPRDDGRRFSAPTLALWQSLHEAHTFIRVQVAECMAMDDAHRSLPRPLN